MDDSFLRTVSALQANLKLLDSQQGALSDFQDMQALRRLKTDLADYIAGHAAKGELPPDPLATIALRLEALKRFLQEAESASRRLLDWKADWLKGIPPVSLEDLQQAGTELAEIEKQLPGMQDTLRGMLDPRDWDTRGGQPILHPELLICAEAMPRLVPASAKSCATLQGFAHGTGKRHEQVRSHLNKIGKRTDELLRLHDDHLSKIAEAESHLDNENFRSAEKVMGTLGEGKFADIVYFKAESGLKKQLALFGRFAALESVIREGFGKGEFKAVQAELETLAHEEFKPNSELGAETSSLVFEMRGVLAADLRSRMRRRRIIATVIVLQFAGAAAIITYSIQEDKRERQAAAEAEAKATRKAAEAKARAEREAFEALSKQDALKAQAEREAAEAMAKTEQEVAEAKAKAEREVAEAKTKLPAEITVGRVGATLGVPLAGKAVMPFAFCPSGAFTLGSLTSEEGRSGDENQVGVILNNAFWMAKTEGTQAQWQAVMGNNPSAFKGVNLPVENVGWDDAQEFIKKVNSSGVMPSGWNFALPTEAQWEYACRAGETGPYSGGTIEQVAWYDGNSENKTHDVGTKKANAWGLHDMHGNVWEWCADWYDDTLPGGVDPSGPSLGVFRVLRGGSRNYVAASCRAASRGGYDPGVRHNYLGFRPALVPSK